ncbi:Uncharacterised protein [uncultured archaeon]|nr:Uncharacterised protein [uncultured archaeon]
MKFQKTLSYFFILASFVFVIPFNITGNAISSGIKTGNLFFGFSFLIFGIVLFLISHEGNLARKVRKSGAVIEDPKKLIHIAREMDYILGKDVKEGLEVYEGKRRITTIPKHKLTWRTSKDILRTFEEEYDKRNY